MAYNFLTYPNPTSIGPYKPGYNDRFTNQQLGMGGSVSTYSMNAFSGMGTTRFNVNSSLPVTSGVVDKFDTPFQFQSGMYSSVLSELMNRSLQFSQGLPYNIYASNGGRFYQLGSQQYNLTNPALLYQGAPANPYAGYQNPYGYAQAQAPAYNPYGYAQGYRG